jgi:hypothetical protein
MTGDILDRHVPGDQIKLIAKFKRKLDTEQPIYQVNKIIDHRGVPGSYEYLVDWKDYSETDRSWEPESSFLDHGAIESYWRNLRQQ